MIKSLVTSGAVIAFSMIGGGCDAIGHQIALAHGGGAPASSAAPVQASAPQNEAVVTRIADQAAPAQGAQHARFTVDTPLGQLIANPQAKAVVDHYAPGMTEGPHATMAAAYSLRQIQAQMPGMISEATLTQMNTELAAIR